MTETEKLEEQKLELEIKAEKAHAQLVIASVAMGAMCAVMGYLISPWAPAVAILVALDSLVSTFMFAMATIIAAYFGFTTWMSKSSGK